MARGLLVFLLVVCALYVEATSVTCAKKYNKKVTIKDGDSYTYMTQAGTSYESKTKCKITYKKHKSCSAMKFSCSAFSIHSPKASCKGGDKMVVSTKETKNMKYCQTSGPDVTTTGKNMKVIFTSNGKTQDTGAVCTVECVSDEVTTSSPTTAPGLGTVITTEGGPVQGRLDTSILGLVFRSFEGIPYAKPPVGALRWLPPQPSLGWEGTLAATQPGAVCPQMGYDESWQPTGQIIGSEDCLFLNIYTPSNAINSTDLLPVMFWIHGGGLTSGTGVFNQPHLLMDYQVVLVTINYRLGSLGFLSLDTPEISGNQGFRDQALALTWVRDNIETFGGDPNKVTIFGESAGSWSVFHQLLNPSADGLFSGAIGQSGTMIGGLGGLHNSRALAAGAGQMLGPQVACLPGQSISVEDCLRDKPFNEIAAAFVPVAGNIDDFSAYPPVLPGAPEDLLKTGNFSRVPVILGGNSGEGAYFLQGIIAFPQILDTVGGSFSTWLQFMNSYLFGGLFSEQEGKNCSTPYNSAAWEYYFDSFMSSTKLGKAVDFVTDTWFWVGINDMAVHLSYHVPVFQYMLTFQDETSPTVAPSAKGLGLGVAHLDDLYYLLPFPPFSDMSTWSPDTWLTQKRMCQMWTNFAKFSNPTPSGIDSSQELTGITWNQVTDDQGLTSSYLNISKDPTIERSTEYTERIQFWHNTINSTVC